MDQAYAPQEQAYPGQDQTYTSLGQSPGQGQDYQNYQGYQPPSYGAQQGQGAGTPPPPQWQGIAGVTPGAPRTKQQGDKGFIGSLFDFSFSSMVTPKIIKVLYVLAVLWTVLFALIYVIVGFSFGGFWGGVAVIVLVAPIMLLLARHQPGAPRGVHGGFQDPRRAEGDPRARREPVLSAGFSAQRSSTAADGVSTGRTSSVPGLTSPRCPQR